MITRLILFDIRYIYRTQQFIEKYIINWKNKFRKLNHKLKYVKHPPHLTILTINLENRKYEIQRIINNIKILKLEKFIIQASSKKYFLTILSQVGILLL